MTFFIIDHVKKIDKGVFKASQVLSRKIDESVRDEEIDALREGLNDIQCVLSAKKQINDLYCSLREMKLN